MDAADKEQLHLALKAHYGAFKEVAERAGVSHTFVYQVLKNIRHNPRVITICTQVLLERENKLAEEEATQKRFLAQRPRLNSTAV